MSRNKERELIFTRFIYIHKRQKRNRKTVISIFQERGGLFARKISIQNSGFFYLRLNYCIVAPPRCKQNTEKARWELHKNAAYCFKQILEAVPHKIASIWQLATDLTNHARKMNKTCLVLKEKHGQTYKQHSLMDSDTWTYKYWLTSKDLQTLCRHWK